MRGVARRESGDLDRAIADFDEALRLDPKYVPAWVERASVWRARNYARSRDGRSRSSDPAGPFGPCCLRRERILFNMKDYAKEPGGTSIWPSLEIPRPSLTSARDDGPRKEGYRRAYEAFAHALTIDPKRHDAYLGLASVYLMAESPGRPSARRRGPADPNNPEGYGNRALLFLSRGMYEKALFNLNEVIRLAPTSARATGNGPGCWPRALRPSSATAARRWPPRQRRAN